MPSSESSPQRFELGRDSLSTAISMAWLILALFNTLHETRQISPIIFKPEDLSFRYSGFNGNHTRDMIRSSSGQGKNHGLGVQASPFRRCKKPI